MERRKFIKNTVLGSVAFAASGGVSSSLKAANNSKANRTKFKMKFAPTLEMFKAHAGDNPIDNIKFIADQGFTAVYDLGLINRTPQMQEKIMAEVRKTGLEFGHFSLKTPWSGPTFVLNNDEVKKMIKERMQAGIELQKRTGVNDALFVPGRIEPKLSWDAQTVNLIENLRYCCELAEKSGLRLIMEPVSDGGVFVTKTSQAKMICIAVNNPNFKFANDIYHMQITEGNIIKNIDNCWDYIGTFHTGDNPGRNEPTTGELNYKNILQHIHDKGYISIIGLEHGKSKLGKEGELALIKAYREVDLS